MAEDSNRQARGAHRTGSQEDEIRYLMGRFPKLTREQVANANAKFGPMRINVETMLARLSA